MEKQRKNYSLKQIAHLMGLSIPTAKKWIKNMVPGIYTIGERKGFFTPGEFERVMNEYDN